MDGDELWSALRTAWREVVDDTRAGSEGDEVSIQVAVDAWPPTDRAGPIAWIQQQIAAGDPAPHFVARRGQNLWLDAVIDHDDDPRAVLVERVELEHEGFTDEQVRRLARHAPHLVELYLEEVRADLSPLFVGIAPWSRLRKLEIIECRSGTPFAPGLATTELPALRELTYYQHNGIPALSGAPWWANVESVSVDLYDVGAFVADAMPNLVTLTVSIPDDEDVLATIHALADRTRRPKLARLVVTRPPDDVALPAIPGLEIIRD